MAIKVQGNTVIDDSRNIEAASLSINGITVTATPAELNYLDGATKNIQDQINSIGFKSYFKGQI